jgi:quercetin dioxygenase-like cupin family protein
MKITHLDELKKEKMTMPGAENVYKQLPISSADGSPTFSFRVFTIEPGGNTPFHRHESEHLNYIIRGDGAVVTEQGQEHPVRTGDFVLILPDEQHQYRNRSANEPFVFICAVPKEYE